MEIFRKKVPPEFAFLSELSRSIKFTDGILLRTESISVDLQYTSEHNTRVEFDQQSAVVCLDVRFIEAVCDYVSCLRLDEERSYLTRAFLVVYGLALDLAFSANNTLLATGMVCDYFVSRATVDVEIADATATEIDLVGDELHTVAEVAFLFVLAHECAHWLFKNDVAFRQAAIERAKAWTKLLADNSIESKESFRNTLFSMSQQFDRIDPFAPCPENLEEIVCDLHAARAIEKALTNTPNRRAAEATVYASSILIWARSRLKRMLHCTQKSSELIDEMAVERGTVVVSALLSSQIVDNATAPHPDDLDFSYLDRMEHMTKNSIAGFLDGRNIARLLAIGTVATRFGLTNEEDAMYANAVARDWIMLRNAT